MMYIKEIIIVLLVLLVVYLKYTNHNLNDKLYICNENNKKLITIQELQNASILAQKADYEHKIKQLPKEITKIRTRYEVIYKNIEASTGDKNASCEDNINTLNSFTY